MSYNLSEEKKRAHKLTLDSRSALEICGVEDVLGFDEERVSLRSSEGGIEIEGSGMKIEVLDTDAGIVKLSGRVNAICYESEGDGRRRGLFRRAR